MLSEIISAYILFSVSVGITANFTVMKPVKDRIRKIKSDEDFIPMLEYPVISSLIFTSIFSLFAPLMLKMVLTGPPEYLIQERAESIIEAAKEDF